MIGGVIIFSLSKKITEDVLEDSYSYTRAICNETNCQDYEIICKNKEVESMNRIHGATIKVPKNWEDPRGNEVKEELC